MCFNVSGVTGLFECGAEFAMCASSYQKLAELHEVKHVDLMHLGQLLAQLNGLLPHLTRHVHC